MFLKDKKITRPELKELNPSSGIVLYPFEYEGFINYEIDTPFTKNIYLREIITAGKTLSGEKVIENLSPPPITISDLLQDISFYLGRALSAMLSQRQGDLIGAKSGFSKSCLFGIRDLIILEMNKFPVSYGDIYHDSLALDIGEFKETVKNTFDIRKRADLIDINLYRNISLLNQVIKEKIIDEFKEKGDIIILK